MRASPRLVAIAALAAACVSTQPPGSTTGTATATPSQVVVRPSPTSPPPSSLVSWPLPDVVAWDVDGRQLAYVSTADPGVIRLRDLSGGAETALTVPAGRRVWKALLVSQGVAYVAAVGDVRGPPARYEIRLYHGTLQTDVLVDEVAGLPEGGTTLGPSLISSEDRTAIVWSRYENRAGVVYTDLQMLDAKSQSPKGLYRTEGIVFPRVLSGRELVVWKRPFGIHNSPTAIDTYMVTGGQERLLRKGAWNVDVADDGKVVLGFGGSVEILDGLGGGVVARLSLGSEGALAIAGRRIAWCSQEGFVSVVDFGTLASAKYRAQYCSLQRIYLDQTTLIWLRAQPGRFVLNLQQLP